MFTDLWTLKASGLWYQNAKILTENDRDIYVFLVNLIFLVSSDFSVLLQF